MSSLAMAEMAGCKQFLEHLKYCENPETPWSKASAKKNIKTTIDMLYCRIEELKHIIKVNTDLNSGL